MSEGGGHEGMSLHRVAETEECEASGTVCPGGLDATCEGQCRLELKQTGQQSDRRAV